MGFTILFHRRYAMLPAISVLLPVYNAAQYVDQAVTSILEQTLADFELILIDDGSTDGSGDKLRNLASKDSRIRLIQRENRGLVPTLNQGIFLAQAPYIARMDADDISMPERFARQYEYLEQHPNVVALGSAIQYMDSSGALGRIKNYPVGNTVSSALMWGSPLAHPAVMLRASAVRKVGGYPDDFPHAEDYALWLRLQSIGIIDNLKDVLLRYRIHGGSVSCIHALQQRTSTLRAQAGWLAQQPAIPEVMIGKDNGQFLKAVALSPVTERALLARMLALSPHLIGIGHDDPEGERWLAFLAGGPASPEIRRALFLYHLRAARIKKLSLLASIGHVLRAFFSLLPLFGKNSQDSKQHRVCR